MPARPAFTWIRRGAWPSAMVVVLAACASQAEPTPEPTMRAPSTPTLAPSTAPSLAASPTLEPTPALDDRVAEILESADATVAQGTVDIEQTVTIEGSTVLGRSVATAAGRATFGDPWQLDVTADFSDFGEMGVLDMIRDGPLVWVRGSVFDGIAGVGRWVLIDLESKDPEVAPYLSIASGQNDLSMALHYLYGATAVTSVTPGYVVDGRETTFYRLSVDLEAARGRIPADSAEALEDALAALRVAGIERQVDAQLWVDTDGLVYRIEYQYALGPMMGGGSMTTAIELTNLGAPLELELPDEAEVVTIQEAVRNGPVPPDPET